MSVEEDTNPSTIIDAEKCQCEATIDESSLRNPVLNHTVASKTTATFDEELEGPSRVNSDSAQPSTSSGSRSTDCSPRSGSASNWWSPSDDTKRFAKNVGWATLDYVNDVVNGASIAMAATVLTVAVPAMIGLGLRGGIDMLNGEDGSRWCKQVLDIGANINKCCGKS